MVQGASFKGGAKKVSNMKIKKTLLALDENLASSIALGYAFRLAGSIPMQVRAGHVQVPDSGNHFFGGGWLRRTWENGLREAGYQTVRRLMDKEKVPCSFVGSPRIFVGGREESLLEELQTECYDLFIEGNLNTPDVADFNALISSPLYSKSPCPILVVKKMVASDRVALLCGDGVDHKTVIPKAISLLNSNGFSFDLIFYRYRETGQYSDSYRYPGRGS
jgi:hypothetical protein